MIDLREHDDRERARPLADRLDEAGINLHFAAQHIREEMRKQGLRVPLTDDEQLFAAADARMRPKA